MPAGIPEKNPNKKGNPRSFTPRPVGSSVTRRGNMYRSGDTYRANLGGGRSMYRRGDTYRYTDKEGNEIVRKGNMQRTGKKGKYKYKRLKSTDFKNPNGNVPKPGEPKKKILQPQVKGPKRMIPEDYQEKNPRSKPRRSMLSGDRLAVIERRLKKNAALQK